MPGLTIHGQAAERTGVFSFGLAGVHPHDVAQWLAAGLRRVSEALARGSD